MTHLVAVQLPPTEAASRLQQLHEQGTPVAPIDPSLSGRARQELLRRLRAHTLVDADGEHALDDPVEIDDAVALVVATSGTTAAPKLVELSAASLDASTAAAHRRVAARPGWRWLCCLPTHHVAGVQTLRRAQACGTRPMVHDGFDTARVTAAISGHQPALVATGGASAGAGDGDDATAGAGDGDDASAGAGDGDDASADPPADVGLDGIALVPTQLRRLLAAGADLSRLQALLLGGAAPDTALVAQARRAGAPVVTTYGLTETCGGCVYDGRPLDGVEVDVDDDGRIRIRGDVVMRRYRGDPQATAAALRDGWLVTPDLGRWDQTGRLQVLGRADDVVISGGENVSAEAVRAALADVDGVAEAAVGGEPDPEWGQRVVAWVAPATSAGEAAPGDDALRAAVRHAVGAYAAPKAIRWVTALPRTALGKVDRTRLPTD
jgi:O-succinylbenzoic acid--CoA ligase